MAWATLVLFRLLSGLSTDDISDADVTALIPYADLKVKSCVFVSLTNDKLDGSIDGTNTKFRVAYWPIGDYDASGTVDASDLTVYSVKADTTTGFNESTELTVSSVSARDGIVTLQAAPESTTSDTLVADYHLTKLGVDSETLEYLASLALSYLAFCNIAGTKGTSPESYSWDGFRVTKGTAQDSLEMRANKILSTFKNVCIASKPARGNMLAADTTVKMETYLTDLGG